MQYYVPKTKIDTDYFRNQIKYINRSQFGPKNNSWKPSISFVTRCMNRLHDLKLTLPKNISDNSNYKKLEFVVLDYNSKDGLGDWIKSNMMQHIESGRLNYYRTEKPNFFCPNHSQNVAFKLASGDLVANLDSDNYTHFNYADRLAECSSVSPNRIIIVPENFLLPGSKRLFLKGRFAIYKNDILQLRGFDEDLDEGFGNDDVNFVFRAMLAGFSVVRYESSFTENRLVTTDEERVSHVKNKEFNYMRNKNGEITWSKLTKGIISVNKNNHWGKEFLVKNFKEELEI